MCGDSPLDERLAMRLLRSLAGGLADEHQRQPLTSRPPSDPALRRDSSTEGLTPREVEVLRLLAKGQTNPQIARNLEISRGTAKIHVQHVIAKLGVSDRTQAAVRALELGLFQPETGR